MLARNGVRRLARSNGFTLVEVLVASALLTTVWVATARLWMRSAAAGAAARDLTLATTLAADKLEQLRARPIDDPALAATPAGALEADIAGCFDRPDRRYARRWSIEALPAYPTDAVAIQVVVVPIVGPGEARLATIKSRKGR